MKMETFIYDSHLSLFKKQLNEDMQSMEAQGKKIINVQIDRKEGVGIAPRYVYVFYEDKSC